MAICAAIYKYGINSFSFYILEIIEKPELFKKSASPSLFLSLRLSI